MKSLKEIHDEIDKDLKPRSFALAGNITIDLQADVAVTWNGQGTAQVINQGRVDLGATIASNSAAA